MILIAVPRYIALKGLESLVGEYCINKDIYTAKSLEETYKILDQFEIQIIYLHSDFVKEFKISPYSKKPVEIVRLIDTRPPEIVSDELRTEIVYLDDDEKTVTKKIKRHLASLEKVEINHHSENGLSDREMQILHEVALGKTNKEIADTLFISLHTVIAHRKNITKKLGIKTVSGLTVYAILNNIILMEELSGNS